MYSSNGHRFFDPARTERNMLSLAFRFQAFVVLENRIYVVIELRRVLFANPPNFFYDVIFGSGSV